MNNIHWDKQSKASWLNQVNKDNPNLGNLEYFRIIDKEILAKYFAFPTDIQKEGHVFKSIGEEYACKIGIKLHYEDTNLFKSALTMALDNGVEYIHFILPENINSDSFSYLIDNVYLDMLITRWRFPSHDILFSCNQLIKQKFENAKTFNDFSTSSNIETDFIPNKTLTYSFQTFHSDEWAKTILNMLKQCSSVPNITENIIFEIYFNNDFLLNICSVRALKLVLNKIWEIYQLKYEFYFEANIDNSILTTDVHSNIYKLAAIGLSASISCVDFLIIPPGDLKSGASDLQWLKTSLHTQHILKQEAHLLKILDPTAGAYFIEDLTEQISNKLWLDLQENLRND